MGRKLGTYLSTLLFATSFFNLIPNAAAQGGPPCRVGSRLERAGMLNRPAVITEVDTKKGLYKVKYDNGDLPEWLPPRKLTGCTGQTGEAIKDDYFIGKWSMFVGPTPHYEDRGSDRYLVVGPGGKAPPLVVNADGSYVWTIDSKTQIKGRWRKMAANELKYGTKAPAILLIKGEDGMDWMMWVRESVGVADTRDRAIVEGMKIGLSYNATKLSK